jgi:hypothetical protein
MAHTPVPASPMKEWSARSDAVVTRFKMKEIGLSLRTALAFPARDFSVHGIDSVWVFGGLWVVL